MFCGVVETRLIASLRISIVVPIVCIDAINRVYTRTIRVPAIVVKCILRPTSRIVFYIFRYAVQFVLVSDNVVVESLLPRKKQLIVVCKFCNPCFQSAYDCSQTFFQHWIFITCNATSTATCRDAINRVSTIPHTIATFAIVQIFVYVGNYNNCMNVIRHYDPQWNFCIRIIGIYIFNLAICVITNVSQIHLCLVVVVVNNFTEIMFSVLGTNCNKINTAIVSVPRGTCRRYSIFI